MNQNTEELWYKLAVDGSAANAELDKTRSHAEKAATAGGRLHDVLDKIGGKAGKDAANGLRSAQFALGGVSQEAASLIGILGDAADVLTGGALVMGLVAVGAVASKVADAYKEAAENAKIFKESADEIRVAVNLATKAALEPARQSIKDLRDELVNFGRDARQMAIEQAVNVAQEQETKLDNLEKRRFKYVHDLYDAKMGKGGKDLETQQEILDTIDSRISVLKETSKQARDDVETVTALSLKLDAKEANRDRALSASKEDPHKGDAAGIADFEEQAAVVLKRRMAMAQEDEDREAAIWKKGFEDRQALRKDELTDIAAAARHENDIVKAKDKFKVDSAKEAALATKELRDREKKDLEDFTTISGSFYVQLANNAITATQGIIDVMATGTQQKGFEEVAVQFLKATGTQLLGLATKMGFEGAELTILGSPQGPAMLGAAGLAAAAGFAMGGAGSYLGAQASKQAAGSALGATSTRGVNSGGSQSSRGDGSVTVNINRGMYGPPSDHDAKAVVDALRQANLRGRTDLRA